MNIGYFTECMIGARKSGQRLKDTRTGYKYTSLARHKRVMSIETHSLRLSYYQFFGSGAKYVRGHGKAIPVIIILIDRAPAGFLTL